jgi:ABC-type transport system involved in cytochrome c biogenesis permease subunit
MAHMAQRPQRPPRGPGPLTRFGRRYASTRRPWSLVTAALVVALAVIVVGAFFVANRQFAVALGAATFAVLLAWLLRVRTPTG